MATDLPWLKFFARDALADGLALDAATFGVCMRLRFAWWARSGSLPDDNRTLARLAGVTMPRFAAMRPDLLGTGWKITAEGWQRDDLLKCYREAKALSDQARGAAKSRWSKETGNASASTAEDAPALPIISTTTSKPKSTLAIAVNGEGEAALRASEYIEVFDEALCEILGVNAHRSNPATTDRESAMQLIANGISLSTFRKACITVFSRLPSDGSKRPGSLAYVIADMDRAAPYNGIEHGHA